MSDYQVTIHGVPLWLVREYIEEMGARLQADGWLHGQGWRARLSRTDDYQIGSIRVGRVHLELAGGGDAVQRARAALEQKLWRAGG